MCELKLINIVAIFPCLFSQQRKQV